MFQIELISQQIHYDLIIPVTVQHDDAANSPSQLESKALVDAERPPIVAVDFHFYAVKILKKEAILAEETGCLGAEAFAPKITLADFDEQVGRQRAGDVEQATESDQLPIGELNYSKLDARRIRAFLSYASWRISSE